MTESEKVLHFQVLKTRPDSEKLAVNAAIVDKILRDFQQKLEQGYFICDGERSVFHETAFQDYLEKYFGFRKAYCKLSIAYNPVIKGMLLFLYRFRSILGKFDFLGLIHKINAILAMQEICEGQKVEK